MRQARLHQLKALDYCRGKDQIALFLEMRLGKTLVALRWADKKPGKHLIVAPSSSLPPWYDELIEEETPKDQIFFLLGDKKKRMEIAKQKTHGWYLINPEGVRVCPDILFANFKTIIADESTFLRNPQAQITKIMVDQCPIFRRAILSGLPAPESPLNYFEQMRFLTGEFMGYKSFWKFRHSLFWSPEWAPYDFSPRKGVTERIKQEVHRRAFVLTRAEAKVGPKKIYEKYFVEMNPLQKKLYKQVDKTFEYRSDNLEAATKWATVKFIWLSRITGGFGPDGKDFIGDGKAKAVLDLLEGNLRGQKVVIWFQFNSEIDYISKVLERAKIGHLVMYGETKTAQRFEVSKRFREEKKIRVILAQVKIGKFSWNWSVAPTAIYYSNSLDMEDRKQSEERILDTQRKEPLLYIDLVCKGTVDVSKARTLRNKYANSRQFMTALVVDYMKERMKK